jgi:hypothetical protein
MTTCLLCPAPAVADGLCVEDGARLWAAHGRIAGQLGALAVATWNEERVMALIDIQTAEDARAFLDRHEAAKAARAAAPLCTRGCKSHQEER